MTEARSFEVEGVGQFVFRKRTMRDEFRIGAEYSRLTEGVPTPTPWLAGFAQATATLKVLVTQAPSGWKVEDMDPLDEETYAKVMAAHGALRAREEFFRSGGGPQRAPAG